MRVAITGAAGYLGKQIIPKLVDDVSIKAIVAVDRVEFPQPHKKQILTKVNKYLQ